MIFTKIIKNNNNKYIKKGTYKQKTKTHYQKSLYISFF